MWSGGRRVHGSTSRTCGSTTGRTEARSRIYRRSSPPVRRSDEAGSMAFLGASAIFRFGTVTPLFRARPSGRRGQVRGSIDLELDLLEEHVVVGDLGAVDADRDELQVDLLAFAIQAAHGLGQVDRNVEPFA